MRSLTILLVFLGLCCLARSQKKPSSTLGSQCNGEEYPSNSDFEEALNFVLAQLQLLTPGTENFNRYGQSPANYASTVYGHAVCHYQSTPADCITCLHGAADGLLEECPRRIGGQIFYATTTLCFIRYENYPFTDPFKLS